MRNQVVKAIEEADRVLFMVDGRNGLMPGDEKIADVLRRSRKKVSLVSTRWTDPNINTSPPNSTALGLTGCIPSPQPMGTV